MASILQSSIGLLRSRLSRRIVSWVFFSLILIEGVVFVPSYRRRQREELRELEELSSEVLFTAKVSAMMAGDHTTLLEKIQTNLRPDSVILGAILCEPNGNTIDYFGDVSDINCGDIPLGQVVRQLTQKGQKYDVAWPRDRFEDRYILVVRHDATKVQQEMRQYVLNVVGLVIIISAFVTLVTILVLERILIIPILHLRDDLQQAGYAVSRSRPPAFHTQAMNRRDELGEVSQAFFEMFERVHREIEERTQAESALKAEQAKSEKLLLNILPKKIAEQLKQQTGAIASRFESATILFADIVDFTSLSAQVPPGHLVCLLNEIFSAFDHIAEQLELEKIKTIGDAYMVVGGVPNPRADHAEAVLQMAVQMLLKIQEFQRSDGTPFRLRIGINTGPVVAGVIGIKRFSYDLWGDTVNIASRMESHGIVNRIQVSANTYHHLKAKYEFEDRGRIHIKGRGPMQTYLYKGQPVEQLAMKSGGKRMK
ncbi:MAG: adenylate/guanylate cyclase domain-containing protein [Leptolyngbyaceae cyanobacterium]